MQDAILRKIFSVTDGIADFTAGEQKMNFADRLGSPVARKRAALFSFPGDMWNPNGKSCL